MPQQDRTPLLVVRPRPYTGPENERMSRVLDFALDGLPFETLYTLEALRALPAAQRCGRRMLFSVSLGESGVNLAYYALLEWLRTHPDGLRGCVGGVLVDGQSELYTKSVARELVFAANSAGCLFVGRPLVEGTGTLDNFTILAQTMETDSADAYRRCTRQLVEQILDFSLPRRPRPMLLALHASSHRTSNTLALWQRMQAQLAPHCETVEIGLRNGAVSDCAGCPYTTCLHFGERGGCFYGGVMVDEVYPAIQRANAILMLCPNYNDALSANLTACINRLTALFRTVRFYDKALFGIVVSGYSGSDIVAGQLIAALNMNKTFYLPAHFCMCETANNAGSVLSLPGIEGRVAGFAQNMLETLCADLPAPSPHTPPSE